MNRLVVAAILAFAVSSFPTSNEAQQIDWTTVWGQSDVNELGFDITTDENGVYVYGSDRGPIGGSPAAFIVKHDHDGGFLWTVRDPVIQDFAYGGGTGIVGNVMMAGGTSSTGPPSAIISSYDSAGNQMWVRQFGTLLPDWAEHVQLSGGGTYLTVGQTLGSFGPPNEGGFDVFVRKFNPGGSISWSNSFGTDGEDNTTNFVVDELGNSYLTGYTEGSTSEDGIFAVKFDANGQQLWTQQFGSGMEEAAQGIAVDQFGNTYIAGYTTGSLGSANLGESDFFFSKIDSQGVIQWTRQLGTAGEDVAADILIDEHGNLLIAGVTEGDAFLNRYDADGNLQWSTTIDQPGLELNIQGLAIGDNYDIYLAGYAFNPGTDDQSVFLARINVVPEPGSGFLLAGLFACFRLHRRKT